MVIADPSVTANTATVTAANALKVDGSGATQPISAGSLPLPTGAATSANQVTTQTTLATIASNTAQLAGIQPISATSLPLPSNAAQETGGHLASLDSKTTAVNTGAVTISTALPAGTNQIGHIISDTGSTTAVSNFPATQAISVATLPLPTGAATAANQTNAAQKTQIVDGSGNVITSTSNALNVAVENFPATQPVSGTVTANAGTGNFTVVQATAANLNATVSGTTTSNQGTPAVTANKWPVALVDSGGVNVATVNATNELLVTDTDLTQAQGSTTAGQLGPLIQGSVLTSPPTYTTAQTSPITMTTAGAVRTDASTTASNLCQSATAATGVGVTVTLPAVVSEFHYITLIEIHKYFTAANAASATPLIVTTTNLPGSLAFTFGQPLGTIGTTDERIYVPITPLKSSAANTATTIVCPATTGLIWRVNVFYYAAP